MGTCNTAQPANKSEQTELGGALKHPPKAKVIGHVHALWLRRKEWMEYTTDWEGHRYTAWHDKKEDRLMNKRGWWGFPTASRWGATSATENC